MKKILSALIILPLMLLILVSCTDADETEDMSSEAYENTADNEDTAYPELIIKITSDEKRIYQTMDNYTFIPDDDVLGIWYVADYVDKMDFDPAYIQYPQDYWRSIEFLGDGTAILIYGGYKNTELWTKDYVLLTDSQIIPEYTIKTIGNTDYLFIECTYYLMYGKDMLGEDRPWYYVFKRECVPEPLKSIKAFDDVRNDIRINISGAYRDFNNTGSDLSQLDLSNFGDMLTLTFNEKTVFPSKDKMPDNEKLQPDYILEAGKNPGLGVRSIHEQGITGKGVSVAIIDMPMIDTHPEYKDKISEYTGQKRDSLHGPMVTSLLVGETTGTAPGSKVYYYASQAIQGNPDAAEIANIIDMIIEKNKILSSNEKIKLISISAAPTPLSDGIRAGWRNGEIYLESVERAKQAGILILDTSAENGIIGACAYDLENPEDVALCLPHDVPAWERKILAPIFHRTSAEVLTDGDFTYLYQANGGLSSAVPYAAGVLAMGWEIKPELTADEIVQILLDTAYVDRHGFKYIYPIAFIGHLQNN